MSALHVMEGLRHRVEFLAGVPLVIAQVAIQRGADALRDTTGAVRRERRNARFVGEFAVRTTLQGWLSRRSSTGRPWSTVVAGAPHDRSSTPSSDERFSHLGVADLLEAIPSMNPEERRSLLDAERVGRRRTRVIELLERLDA